MAELIISTIAVFAGFLAALVMIARLHATSKNTIVFDEWANFAELDGDPGKSLADLLLYSLRDIQFAHQRSRGALDLKNPYDDIPAFQQELDITLTAAVELQRTSATGGPAVNLLLALLPIRPTRFRGSIHRFGEDVRLNVVLENARNNKTSGTPQWTGVSKDGQDFPDVIQRLAYEIYLALTASSAFTNALAFRDYTEALKSHLRYGETSSDEDCRQAEGLYKQALDQDPKNPAVLYNVGVLSYYMFEEDRNRAAEECFLNALPAAHGSLRAQINSGLANVYSMKYHRFKSGDANDLHLAIRYGEEALHLDDNLDVVLKAVALAHHQASESAQRTSTEALSTGEAALARVEARSAAAHRHKAARYYQKAIHVNPMYYTAHNNLGNLYLELAKITEEAGTRRELLRNAVALFKDTMAIRPSYYHAYDNLGNAYYELAIMGEEALFTDAARYYLDACRLKPSYAEAKNDLAMLYLTRRWREHDVDSAIQLHREALASVPDKARRRSLEEAFEQRQELAGVGAGEPKQVVAAGTRALASRARRHRRWQAALSLAKPRRGDQ